MNMIKPTGGAFLLHAQMKMESKCLMSCAQNLSKP